MTLICDARHADVVVIPPCEIDIATGDLLAQRIRRACALRPQRVIVDFASVTFCDSTAVAVLLQAQREVAAGGAVLVVRNPSVLLQRIAAFLGSSTALGMPGHAVAQQCHPVRDTGTGGRQHEGPASL